MLTRERLIAAFNEWMRRFTEEPEKFRHEWEEVQRYVAEQADGTPTYGQQALAYLEDCLPGPRPAKSPPGAATPPRRPTSRHGRTPPRAA